MRSKLQQKFGPRYATTLLAGALLLGAESAAADVAPPPDYEESCTRELQEAPGEYCQLVGAYYADPFGCVESQLEGLANTPADASVCESAAAATDADCCQSWIDAGYTYRCQTYGASVFDAMWCRARRDADPAPPVASTEGNDDNNGGGCSVSGGQDSGLPAAAALLALGALAACSRRRRCDR